MPIGAASPGEIAVSIIADIIAVRRDRILVSAAP
jgi:xanthine/CO dehydrogenase XdhC/CoxF family maturation factor